MEPHFSILTPLLLLLLFESTDASVAHMPGITVQKPISIPQLQVIVSINILNFLSGKVFKAKMTHPMVHSAGTYTGQTVFFYSCFNSALYLSFGNPGMGELGNAGAPHMMMMMMLKVFSPL